MHRRPESEEHRRDYRKRRGQVRKLMGNLNWRLGDWRLQGSRVDSFQAPMLKVNPEAWEPTRATSTFISAANANVFQFTMPTVGTAESPGFQLPAPVTSITSGFFLSMSKEF